MENIVVFALLLLSFPADVLADCTVEPCEDFNIREFRDEAPGHGARRIYVLEANIRPGLMGTPFR